MTMYDHSTGLASARRVRHRRIAGLIALMGAALTMTAASAQQQAIGTIRLQDGSAIEGAILKADLNVLAVRRAIGGVRLLPNAALSEMRLATKNGDGLVFRFDEWVNGAASIERNGDVVEIKDWVETENHEVSVAKTTEPTDDGAPPTLSFDVTAGVEGERAASIQLELSKPAEVMIPLVYATSDGTATANTDYDQLTGFITFEPGVQISKLQIPILDDELSEEAEFLRLIVNADPKLVNMDDSKVLVLIRDND